MSPARSQPAETRRQCFGLFEKRSRRDSGPEDPGEIGIAVEVPSHERRRFRGGHNQFSRRLVVVEFSQKLKLAGIHDAAFNIEAPEPPVVGKFDCDIAGVLATSKAGILS